MFFISRHTLPKGLLQKPRLMKIIDVLIAEIAGAYFLTTPQKIVSVAAHLM